MSIKCDQKAREFSQENLFTFRTADCFPSKTNEIINGYLFISSVVAIDKRYKYSSNQCHRLIFSFYISSTAKDDDDEMDLRTEFLMYLQQAELCEAFYNYMKAEDLAYLLEFYLACDGLKNTYDQSKKPQQLIRLIYKHYLSEEKFLSSSKSVALLPKDLLLSIEQRLAAREFHRTFYDQAQEYVLKYMLQMCFPKFLIEQQNHSTRTKRTSVVNSATFRRTRTTNKRKEKIGSSNGTQSCR